MLGAGGSGGEMTQTLYAHMNKIKIKIIKYIAKNDGLMVKSHHMCNGQQ
jgi:hypothetical protein